MNIRLSKLAQADLKRQLDWLAERSPAAAERARAAMFQALDQLTDYPRFGKAISKRMREDHVPFGKHGYIIRYQVRPAEIWISRIYHGAQDRPDR